MPMFPLASIVKDFTLYPRHRVDAVYVNRLVEAIRSHQERVGPKGPRFKWKEKLIVDEKSKRLVDGFHRADAELIVYGEKVQVDVEFRTYKDEAALVEDAVTLNVCHGRKLDAVDLARAEKMLEERGVSDARIACILHVSKKKLGTIKVRFAESKTPTRLTVPSTSFVTLKRSALHMAGKTLTATQAQAHDMMPGTSLVLTARQLRTAIESGLVDAANQALVDELTLLSEALTRFLDMG